VGSSNRCFLKVKIAFFIQSMFEKLNFKDEALKVLSVLAILGQPLTLSDMVELGVKALRRM
jgi:hypothetical protein